MQTIDGGYIIAGTTASFGAGSDYDVWLIKTNSFGNETWNKTYGGSGSDKGRSVQLTNDNGYIITGTSNSFGPGGYDAYLIKTTSNGSEEWNETYGGSSTDNGYSVEQTSDNGYIISGYTESYDVGSGDVWLIKTGPMGNETWNNTFGGTSEDGGRDILHSSDGGYVIIGYTQSYSLGSSDIWLVKVEGNGSEEWNKTFGGGSNDRGFSIKKTNKGGYVFTGFTWSFGAGANDAWLIETDEWGSIVSSFGYLTSVNLLVTKETGSINTFNCNVSTPGPSNIKIQFSQDSINWYNSGGLLDGWNTLSNGYNSIDLSSLGWQGSNFYYRMNFSSSGIEQPIALNNRLYYSQYLVEGTLESQAYDAGDGVNWITLASSVSIIEVSGGFTNITFQLKTASTQPGLAGENFVGPGGSTSTYYGYPIANIWGGHDLDQWIQYKAFLNTPSGDGTPTLFDITINYNHFPSAPVLMSPTNNSDSSDNTPLFTWNFVDSDGTQSSFQVEIDDDIGFGSIDYNSGEQTSSNEFWQFPFGTSYTDIADGTWYWRVRTKDEDDDGGPYSGYYQLNIITDTTPPNNFVPTADYDDWTSNTGFKIYFSTTDAGSGIDYYEVKIDSGSFSIQTSPFTLPVLSDGVHNITVRAYDNAGNYVDGYIDVYIDTIPPLSFTPTAEYDGWTSHKQFNISFSTTDSHSGIDYYEVKIDSGSATTQISPYYLPALSEGEHNITVRAYDKAGNYIDSYVDVFVDTISPSISHTKVTSGSEGIPINITAVVTDSGSGENVYLYVKKPNVSTYTEVQMNAIGNTY
ncbi:MAG: hypothetical protein ACXAC2_19235, partial [Candidatus Kariarchaeaceae archaeon]